MPTSIRSCNCPNKFQDSKYGKNRRVWNMMGNNNGWRCTTCQKEDKSTK